MAKGQIRDLWRQRLYTAVGLGLRMYIAALGVVGLYSLLWLLELSGYLASDTLATIWLAIAGMGRYSSSS